MDWVAESKPGGTRAHSIVGDYKVVAPYLGSLEIANVLAKGPEDGQHQDKQHWACESGALTKWKDYMTEQRGQGSRQRQAFVPEKLRLACEESWL